MNTSDCRISRSWFNHPIAEVPQKDRNIVLKSMRLQKTSELAEDGVSLCEKGAHLLEVVPELVEDDVSHPE
jgi:hypothetical protein